MEQNLFFIKLGEKLVFSDKEGILKEKISIDFKIELENNIAINLYEILFSLNTHLNNNKIFSINKINERYSIKNKETNDEYKLDDLLILFFKKMKENLENKEKLSLKKLILIYDFISYEIILIIQQAAFVNELNIINMIDNNKALRY